MTDEFYVALSKDLGYKDKFFATFWQIGNSITHIEHTISHIHSYNKVRKVDTTLMCAPGTTIILKYSSKKFYLARTLWSRSSHGGLELSISSNLLFRNFIYSDMHPLSCNSNLRRKCRHSQAF
jgi:hypothetical protein